MLVPVLEVLLSGYNCIFFDVDIAMVLDPVPFLIKGTSDFVSTVEMRSCPDSYTPTFLNTSTPFAHKRKEVNSMSSVNWFTVEPNTGIMSVRSTEAGIGFYTNWLLRIISVNELNDQKAMHRYETYAHHSVDCVYGTDGAHGHHHAQPHGIGNLRRHNVPGHHTAHDGAHGNNNRARHRWAGNYSALVEDAAQGNYAKPVRFCFASELLFQNGQTAFTCGVKPSFKDSWILEMYKNGLPSPQVDSFNHHNSMRQDHAPQPDTPRFAVTVHANFCDKKTHELTVRGLWLVTQDSPEAAFTNATCRAYNPLETMYGTRNWTADYLQVKNKRDYMYETFVQPGKLIQSTNGLEVYLVDESRRKQLIPDGDTFIAKIGGDKWGEVRFLPQPIMDSVPLGPPIPSVREAKDDVKKEAEPVAPTTAPVSAPTQPPIPAATATVPAVSEAIRVVEADPQVLPPPPEIDVQALPPKAAAALRASHTLDDIVVGMLVRSQRGQTVYFIDKRLHKRKVPSMEVFTRLFGAGRTKDVVVIPEDVLTAIPEGEALM
jgi:hypothetical protein